MGLMFEHEKEDTSYIKELVMNKMEKYFGNDNEKKEDGKKEDISENKDKKE